MGAETRIKYSSCPFCSHSTGSQIISTPDDLLLLAKCPSQYISITTQAPSSFLLIFWVQLVMPICIWMCSYLVSQVMMYLPVGIPYKKKTASSRETHQLLITLHLQHPPCWNDSLPSFVQVFPGNCSCFTSCFLLFLWHMLFV